MTMEDMVQKQSLYRQILGRQWNHLPASIRALHHLSDRKSVV